MDKSSRRKKKYYFFFILFLNDLFFLILSFLAAFVARFGFGISEEIRPFVSYYVFYSLAGIVVILAMLGFNRLYSLENIHPGMDINTKILLSAVIGIFAISTLNFYIGRDDGYFLSRAWILYAGLFSFLFLILGRVLARRIINVVFNKAGMKRNAIIVGVNEEGRRIAKTFHKVELDSANIAGFVDSSERLQKEDDIIEKFNDYKVLGSLDGIKDYITQYNIDTIIISSPGMRYDEVQGLLDSIKDFDLEILMSPSLFEFSVSRMRMFDYAGIPLIQITHVTQDWKMKVSKFIIDYTLGILIFLFFIIIYPFVGLAIKLDSEGPVLYAQERYGENFKKIRIYKFRTMVKDADKQDEILSKLYDKESGFKIKDDPRITRVGKFLRKTSLDEFPQIINVMKGELSIVGPRALAIEEGDQLEEWEKKRMTVKQGITGLWQISGRSDLSYEERMKLDLYYIHNWSLWLELKIIYFTVLRVLFRKGAY
ncbi:MAG: sugar transferase [Actinomycetota bacterium]|nr:sugar transferase [Actinomycetota bacterium]